MMKIKIAETAQKHGVKSAYALQKALNISPTIAARLWKGEFDKIGIKTLERLCDYFYCQPNDFLEYPLTLSGNTKLRNDTQTGNTQTDKTESDNTQLSNTQSDNTISFHDALAEFERIGKRKSDSSLRRYLKSKKLKGELVGGEWQIERGDLQDFIESDFFQKLK